MDSVTRRRFLIASGVAGGAALAAGATSIGLHELMATANRAPAPQAEDAGRLVIITLYGGNDGLNTLIPFTDKAYHSMRPELAYAADRVLPITGELALNPSLPGLKKLWDAGRLGIVPGVGYPRPDHSHFRSMDIWHTAAPSKVVPTGWVGRWLDSIKAVPETAVSFETVLPPLLVGQSQAGACVNVNGLRLPRGITSETVSALGKAAAGETQMRAQAARALRDLLRVDGVIQEAKEASRSPSAAAPGLPATGTGGDSPIANQLNLVAQCIEARIPTVVYSVSMGGFDTHASERAAHEVLLRRLDEALTAFVERMAASEAGRRTTVVVYSEFGRRVQANASDGTDHGTAGPLFLLGAPVAGGLHGEYPSLKDLDDGDLKMTTDFRDVFGGLIQTVLKQEPGRYIEDHKFTELPIFA